jgi:hypothetical protein
LDLGLCCSSLVLKRTPSQCQFAGEHNTKCDEAAHYSNLYSPLQSSFSKMPPSCSRSEPEDQQNDIECIDMHQQETEGDSTNRTAINSTVPPRLRLPMRPIERQGSSSEGGDADTSRSNASARREWVCALLQVALEVANDPTLDDDDDDDDDIDSRLAGSSESTSEIQ